MNMDRSKIENRVRKLIKLAGNNPNVHEAAAAFAHAQLLASEHGLNLDDLSRETDEPEARKLETIQQQPLERWKKGSAWKTKVGNAVARSNNCGYFIRKSRSNGGLFVYGQPSDMNTATYIYQAITREIEGMVREQARGHGHRYARSFKMGAADAVAKRMPTSKDVIRRKREEAHKLDGASNALVRVNAAEVYVEKVQNACQVYGREVLKLRSMSGFSTSTDARGYAAGRAAGARMNLGAGRTALP